MNLWTELQYTLIIYPQDTSNSSMQYAIFDVLALGGT